MISEKYFTHLLLAFLIGCANTVIISPYGLSNQINYKESLDRIDDEVAENNSNKYFHSSYKAWSFLGHTFKAKVRLGKEIRPLVPQRAKLYDFTITTTYTWSDIILGIVPLATPRTIIYSGKYRE